MIVPEENRPKNQFAQTIVILGFIVLVSIGYFLGLPGVPFHPDEQTYLFMSGDVDRFFSNPGDLFWNPSQATELRQKYRLRDAPLSRWLIGIGRQIARKPAPQVDWDWSKDWETNQANGALPPQDLLLAGRLSVAFLFPLSLWLMFQVAKSIGNNLSGWAAMVILASHGLVLLHTRRAMAESALLFTCLLTLWLIQRPERSPWWIGLAAALAFNAKQSAAPLVLLAGVAVWCSGSESGLRFPQRFRNFIFFCLTFGLVTFLLNPFLWSNPLAAGRAAWFERNQLVVQQVEMVRAVNPEMVWETPFQRLQGFFIHLFFSRPAIADVANYVQDTQSAAEKYFTNPLHSLLRNLMGGAILAFLTFFGFALAVIRLRNLSTRKKSLIRLLEAATLLQLAGLTAFVPLPFQRYVIPLLPFQCLWAAKGMEGIVDFLKAIARTLKHKRSSGSNQLAE
jgi:4-amino-4-deoxy-L-arabinose transferase-like glycosyltransferase